MEIRNSVANPGGPNVTIRVAGKLLEGHISYLHQLIESAADCGLWPLLSLTRLEELDQAALRYLVKGENRDFAIVSCPEFVRQQMDTESGRRAA
jgi:hypothetical protein